MAHPCATTGSLNPGFPPDRPVGLTVKPACAFALPARLPSVLSRPLEASVTLLEATTPVKLPTMRGLLIRIRTQNTKGWYFNVGSPNPDEPGSQPPTYPTHSYPMFNAKL